MTLSCFGGGWCHSSDKEKEELMANAFVKVQLRSLSEERKRGRRIIIAGYNNKVKSRCSHFNSTLYIVANTQVVEVSIVTNWRQQHVF